MNKKNKLWIGIFGAVFILAGMFLVVSAYNREKLIYGVPHYDSVEQVYTDRLGYDYSVSREDVKNFHNQKEKEYRDTI